MQRFNVISFLINLVVGWFLVSFLQSLVVSIATGGWADLLARFQGIALFRDGTGAMINGIVIVAGCAVGIVIGKLGKR